VGESPTTGRELFVVDETAAAPTPLKVVPGPDGATQFEDLVVWEGQVYFVANDTTHGAQIWRSDGVTLTRLTTLTSGATPSDLAAGPGGVYFVYDEPTFGTEVWRTNGTTTVRISDIAPGSDDAYPSDLVAVGDRLAFADDDGNGREMYLSDGLNAYPLPEVWPGVGASNPAEVAVDPTGSVLLLSGIGPEVGRELYRIDLDLFADGFESGDLSGWVLVVEE
jgi:ELWxxDGT repeat protein